MIVTPYFPKDAQVIAKGWMRDHNLPVFVKAYDHSDDPKLHIPTCPNCNGVGVLFLQFANAGPYPSPMAGGRCVTWYDGDGRYGKGWYVIERTDAFVCPECKNRPYEPGELVSKPIDVTAMMNAVKKVRNAAEPHRP